MVFVWDALNIIKLYFVVLYLFYFLNVKYFGNSTEKNKRREKKWFILSYENLIEVLIN